MLLFRGGDLIWININQDHLRFRLKAINKCSFYNHGKYLQTVLENILKTRVGIINWKVILKLALQPLWKAISIFKRMGDVFCPGNQLAEVVAQNALKSV